LPPEPSNRTFAITEVAAEVPLDDQNRGAAVFTVTNLTGDHVRGRAAAVPGLPGEAGWLSLTGDAERAFPPGWTEQYRLAIAVTAGTPAGRHTLRLDVEGLTPPHTETVQGPPVSYQSTAVRPLPADTGYLATLAGAGLGALAGMAVGALPAVVLLLASRLTIDIRVDLVVLGAGALLLGFPAMVAGAWLNLRGRHSAARETALVLAAVAGGLWLLLGLALGVVGLVSRSFPGGLAFLFILVGVLVPPVPARIVTLRLVVRRRQGGAIA
jgi:hypothetical protein